MPDADHGRVDVAVSAVVVLWPLHQVGTQYVVRALGLAVVGWCGGRIGPGAGAAGATAVAATAAAAADGPAGSVTAAGPILVLAPCGLGLIPPINFVVQIFVLAKSPGDKREGEGNGRGWVERESLINLLRDTWLGRFSMLLHSSRTRARSWRIGCLRR